jgi:hypothetical protein
LRDLYKRKATLEYWINRVKTDLVGTDRDDLLILIEYMQDRERASLWITRYITALITMRKQLGKTFRNATKDDLRLILKWMEEKNRIPLRPALNSSNLSASSVALSVSFSDL